MDIKLAISRSGHDKDRIYVIIKEEANLVYLADGKLKPVEKPKRKNSLPNTFYGMTEYSSWTGRLSMRRSSGFTNTSGNS